MEWEEMNNIEAMLETICEPTTGSSTPSTGSRDPTSSPISLETKLHDDEGMSGFVFFKGFRIGDEDAAMVESQNLDAIRTALESVEHQLEFLRTLKSQQQAERDAALARLNKSHSHSSTETS